MIDKEVNVIETFPASIPEREDALSALRMIRKLVVAEINKDLDSPKVIPVTMTDITDKIEKEINK